jgi:hypothetical protein
MIIDFFGSRLKPTSQFFHFLAYCTNCTAFSLTSFNEVVFRASCVLQSLELLQILLSLVLCCFTTWYIFVSKSSVCACDIEEESSKIERNPLQARHLLLNRQNSRVFGCVWTRKTGNSRWTSTAILSVNRMYCETRCYIRWLTDAFLAAARPIN